VHGNEFSELYKKYENSGKFKRKMKSRDLWFKILDSQMETGTPYLCYKDAANNKSNQKNLGTIKSSNLCTEIIQYSDSNETAVCNLASIALNRFVNHDEHTSQYTFNYEHLHDVVRVVTRNLNRVIDINYYPTEKTRTSNLRHRPIGIGVQGMADVFFMMNIAFHSEEAIKINKLIFETIYHAALSESNIISAERAQFFGLLDTTSCAIPKDYLNTSTEEKCKLTNDEYNNLKNTPNLLGAYSSFIGSPMSNGIFQFDMWNIAPTPDRYDWESLRFQIIKHGLRNSLLVAPMPTASTSQILGNNECFEPITSNIYMRRTLAGEFIMVNKYLIREFISLGIWNEKIKNNIIANRGSIQQLDPTLLPGLTDHIKNKYKTVWEIPMKHLIDMAADRGAFICQSQSLNLWIEEPNYNTLTSMHFYSWTRGLKTGIYYLRRKPKHQAQQFTIEPEKNDNDNDNNNNNNDSENISFSKYGNGIDGDGGSGDANTCEMCSS
jgi:ribonucleotide reductase alpha subunit